MVQILRSSFPFWQILGLVGLFMLIASASIVDPRPNALGRLGEIFRDMSDKEKDDSFENKRAEKDIQTWK